ncbi:MAG: hypothetical protein H6Q67_1715 [Firmicutes bacterium]|nr:hypothetical protein [Bacillota bacterium]
MILDEILTFNDVPQWVAERLTIVVHEFGEEQYDFYIQSLKLDEHDRLSNECVALFLTSKEFIKVKFSLRHVYIEKHKLSAITDVIKQIEVPTDDVFKDEDAEYISADLIFNNKPILCLGEPELKTSSNMKNFKKLIKHL